MERKVTKIVRFLINPFCFGLNGRKMTENYENGVLVSRNCKMRDLSEIAESGVLVRFWFRRLKNE